MDGRCTLSERKGILFGQLGSDLNSSTLLLLQLFDELIGAKNLPCRNGQTAVPRSWGVGYVCDIYNV